MFRVIRKNMVGGSRRKEAKVKVRGKVGGVNALR
jgi:hypothetical protein